MESVRSLLRKVIFSQYYAVLSSSKDGRSYSNLVAFAASNDLITMVFATAKETEKFKRIKNNGNVSLLIDNRTNLPADVSKAVAITASGRAGEAPTDRSKELLLKRHPGLRRFINSSDTVVISIEINEYVLAHFDSSERLSPDSIQSEDSLK
jgi:nitroimidazol reductase NimA-like FMN-containing flavoprotein (pyridoxamine 5'-phosphate oxidase superfamily)